MNTKGFINPLWLLVIPLILIGGGAYWYTQQSAPNEATQEPVVLPVAEQTLPVAEESQQSQLSLSLAEVTPQITDDRMDQEVYERIFKEVAGILKAQGIIVASSSDSGILLTVGKRYVLYDHTGFASCRESFQITRGPFELIDAVTGKVTSVRQKFFFQTLDKILFWDDQAIYYYAPDAAALVEIPGSRIAANESYRMGESTRCGFIPIHFESGTDTLVVEVGDRQGVDAGGRPILGPTHRLTFPFLKNYGQDQ